MIFLFMTFRPWHDFSAPQIVMGSWAVHNFLEYSPMNIRGAKVSFSFMEISLSCMEKSFSFIKMKFFMHEVSYHDFSCMKLFVVVVVTVVIGHRPLNPLVLKSNY